MKQLLILMLIVMVFISGCTPNLQTTPAESSTASKEVQTSSAPTNTVTQGVTVTQGGTTVPTQSATKEAESTKAPAQENTHTVSPTVTPTPAPVVVDKSLNMLCGIDMHGRSFMPISGTNDKQVGIYYFVWHGMEPTMTGTYNNTQLLIDNSSLLFDGYAGEDTASPAGKFHYWDEPIWGYYRSTDKWVIAKQMEMLTLAGVDFLYIDVTNANIYLESCVDLFTVLMDMYKSGWDAPKIVFYANSYSIPTITNLYNYYYKTPGYNSLWYRPDGVHPMIIGNYVPDTDKAEARLRGDNSYDPDPLSDEILAYFDFRASQWPFDPYKQNGIPWNEWTYPQPIHNGVMNVSLAQHPDYPFSDSIAIGRHLNWGRGYNFVTGQNVYEDATYGTNFQSQWNTVHANSNQVDMVTVTGWNEWMAVKINRNGLGCFVDNFNSEFSRDIEPQSNNGFQDAYYLQLIDNVRRFKGTGDTVTRPKKITVDINDAGGAFNTVTSVYYSGNLKSYSRSSTSVGNVYTYKQDAPRNNLQNVKVADDGNNLYFLVESDKALTRVNSNDFANIYIGIDNLERKGWEGYEFVISPSNNKLYSLAGDGRRTEVGNVNTVVDGKHLLVSVPIKSLGATSGIYFKVTDNFNSTNIMDSYTQGKCIPMGRLSWYYYLAK